MEEVEQGAGRGVGQGEGAGAAQGFAGAGVGRGDGPGGGDVGGDSGAPLAQQQRGETVLGVVVEQVLQPCLPVRVAGRGGNEDDGHVRCGLLRVERVEGGVQVGRDGDGVRQGLAGRGDAEQAAQVGGGHEHRRCRAVLGCGGEHGQQQGAGRGVAAGPDQSEPVHAGQVERDPGALVRGRGVAARAGDGGVEGDVEHGRRRCGPGARSGADDTANARREHPHRALTRERVRLRCGSGRGGCAAAVVRAGLTGGVGVGGQVGVFVVVAGVQVGQAQLVHRRCDRRVVVAASAAGPVARLASPSREHEQGADRRGHTEPDEHLVAAPRHRSPGRFARTATDW
ncbi:hypothetical protein GCM10009565_09190 [Amycolatopsis albidoflavus]